MDETTDHTDILTLTASIVSAFASNNSLSAAELPDLIRTVHGSLEAAGKGEAAEPKAEPAVPIRRSVKRDFIVCLECGSQHKMLRRHLRREHGLTPAEYRDRWSLKADYPMVAPSYAEKRSELAKRIGLGRKSGRAAATRSAPTRGGTRTRNAAKPAAAE